MAFNYFLPLRIVQAVFAIIVLGLSGYVAHWWGGAYYHHSPSEVNFLVFTSVWTLLALIYLIVAPWRFERAAHPFAILAVDALTMLFWFAGFIAAAAFLGDRYSCYGRVCDSLKAAIVFGAFLWLLFAATTILNALRVFRSRNSRDPKSDPNIMAHNGV